MIERATNSVCRVVFCLILSYGLHATAQDWPQWRGPNRDAKATGFQAPASWPKELTKKWQVTVGDGVATPALVGGKLYVFTRQDGKEVLHCLDAASGAEAWQKGYEAEAATGAAGGFPGPRSSPTVADGKVITFGVRGILSCFDATNGNQLWQKEDLADSWPMFFTSSSPIVVDGLCIAQLGGRKDGGIIAYDLTTGAEKWRWMGTGPAYGSPVLMTVDGAKVIFAPTEGKLIALDAAGGKLLWDIPYSQGRYISATPIVEGQTLIIAGPGTGMTAFKMTKQGDKLVEEKLWSNTDNSVGFNTPVLRCGMIFGLSTADQLFCIDIFSKKTVWSTPFTKPAADEKKSANAESSVPRDRRIPATLVQFVQQEDRDKPKDRDRPDDKPRDGAGSGPRRGDGPGRFGPGGQGRGPGGRGRMGGGMARTGYGSIVDVGPALVALTPAGELVVFKPGDEAFTELARYKVASGGTYAYPIPSGHGIYVKDQNALTLWTVD